MNDVIGGLLQTWIGWISQHSNPLSLLYSAIQEVNLVIFCFNSSQILRNHLGIGEDANSGDHVMGPKRPRVTLSEQTYGYFFSDGHFYWTELWVVWNAPSYLHSKTAGETPGPETTGDQCATSGEWLPYGGQTVLALFNSALKQPAPTSGPTVLLFLMS